MEDVFNYQMFNHINNIDDLVKFCLSNKNINSVCATNRNVWKNIFNKHNLILPNDVKYTNFNDWARLFFNMYASDKTHDFIKLTFEDFPLSLKLKNPLQFEQFINILNMCDIEFNINKTPLLNVTKEFLNAYNTNKSIHVVNIKFNYNNTQSFNTFERYNIQFNNTPFNIFERYNIQFKLISITGDFIPVYVTIISNSYNHITLNCLVYNLYYYNILDFFYKPITI